MSRPRFLRTLAWLAVVSLLTGLAGACAPQQEAAKGPAAPTKQEAVKAPAARAKLVLSAGVDVSTLSTFSLVIITPDRVLVDHISDRLVNMEDSGEVTPSLAESWKTLDDLTWQFKLRQGVKFHNGEPFDAEAVKFTVETLIDPATKAPTIGNYAFINRVEILDQYTVNIKTKAPAPVTLGNMSQLHMVPPKYVKEKGLDYFSRNPVGTGPYKFVEWVKDDHITLTANQEYWRGAPKVETIVFKPIKEASTRVGALIAGEVDIAVNVPPELVPDIQKSARATIKTMASTRIFLMGMSNLDKSLPTANRLVREALTYAIDRESLNRNILGGYGKAAYGLNPTTFGFNPNLKPIPYDPKKAKELLAQAGYPNGFSVVMDSPDGRYLKDKEMAQAIAGQLGEIGVKVEVVTYEFGVFTKRVYDHKTSPLVLFAWGDTKHDPDSANNLTLKTGGLWSQYTNPELDSLIGKIATTVDPEQRKKLIFEEQDILRQDFPYVYIAQIGDIYGLAKDLGWNPRSDEAIWLLP